MVRKIGIILFLYYAVGTCASQGASAPSGGSGLRMRPETAGNVRVAVYSGAAAAKPEGE